MWKNIFGIGFLLLSITIFLYRGAAVVFKRGGVLLWDPDRRRTTWENAAEFFLSVFLSIMASAAIGFLVVGFSGLLGADIQIP